MVVIVTLIRHGESKSNLNESGYTGWKDSPLTELGERQADELGKSFNATSTHFTHLYSSDLSRAHTTALSILKHHHDHDHDNDDHLKPNPPLILTPKLREIHFGIAEGYPYTPGDAYPLPLAGEGQGKKTLETLYEEGVFPDFRVGGRDAKFPKGESLNELEERIREVVREVVVPLVFEKEVGELQTEEENYHHHVGFVSHGLCLFEMINVLLKLDPENEALERYRGHHNTGWTRLEISVKDERDRGEYDVNSNRPLPPLQVRLVTFDSHDHLASLPPPSNPGVGVVVV